MSATNFRTTLIEALNSADRVRIETDDAEMELENHYVGTTITLEDSFGNQIELPDAAAEVELNADGWCEVQDTEGKDVRLFFYVEDSRPLTLWDIRVPGGVTGAGAEARFNELAAEQGWNDASLLALMREFIDANALWVQFTPFAQRAAREENGHTEGVVHSSNAEITIDLATGAVLKVEEFNPNEPAFDDLASFDLDEYFAHYSRESRAEIREFDVLDLAFIMKDGKRIEADQGFRDNVEQHGAKT